MENRVEKKEFPLVSVIIPTFGRAKFIKRAIISVINQTYKNIEVIVIDDNGYNTEEQIRTREVLHELIYNAKIKYITHCVNKGGSAARNTGIIESKGEFIAFLDDDDYWIENKLELQIKEVLKTDNARLGLVYCKMYSVLENGSKYKKINVKCHEGNVINEIIAINFVATSTALVRRNCFNEVGFFDTNLPNRQDHDMFLRISQKYDFKCVDEYLVAYTVHANRVSRNYKKKKEGWNIFLTKWMTLIDHYPESKRRLLYNCNFELAKLANLNGYYKESISYLLNCYKYGNVNYKLIVFSLFILINVKLPFK